MVSEIEILDKKKFKKIPLFSDYESTILTLFEALVLCQFKKYSNFIKGYSFILIVSS